MKLLLIIFSLAITFSSCEKNDNDNERKCPEVDSKVMTAAVITSFQTKYPNVPIIKWFNKDNKGYVAYAVIDAKKSLVHFDNSGNYIKIETKLEQHGQHHDNDDECECEIED